MIKFILLMLCATALAAKYNCTVKSAQLILKRPTYEFSMKLLDQVSQATAAHFVFSPMSTYMQLLAFAEGARGRTSREIRLVTKHHRLKCIRRKWKVIVNSMYADLGPKSKRKSLMVVNRLVKVKPDFVREVKRLKSMDVLKAPFNYPKKAADIANRAISSATDGLIEDTFGPYDFNFTVLLTADASYYRGEWTTPFNPVYTSEETFYGQYNGKVLMMHQAGYFHIADMAVIQATVLELPCGLSNRVSMLVFLPFDNNFVNDVFYNLQKIRLVSIFNTFKMEGLKFVDVKLPKFKITTDVDNIPELLNDLGVKSLFHPKTANLKGISDYKVYASLMTQVAHIDVDESGVTANIAEDMVLGEDHKEFIANKPFAYLLVDKRYDVVLYGGIYSVPSID